jgi:hypothetical protein
MSKQKDREDELQAERVQQSMAEVLELIDREFSEPRRTQVLEMLAGDFGNEYFTAPASSNVNFHLCEVGGLARHSLNVVSNLLQLSMIFAKGRWSREKLIFCGLFHDLGKAGDGERPYYVSTKEEWKLKRGSLYDINKPCVAMPTSERGLYVLQRHGVTLDHEEYLAIRLNDGQYAEENRWYSMKEPELALLVHMADLWSTKMEKPERY